MSTTSFITDPTRTNSTSDSTSTSTSTSTIAASSTTETQSRESNDLFAATGSGRDIVVSRDDKDKE